MTVRLLPRLAAVSILPTLLLAGCGPSDQFPPICPSVALLADAADLTQYSPKGQDLTDLMLDGRITAVPATCRRGAPGVVSVTLKVSATVTRGPAFTERDVSVPIIVGVTDGGEVRDRKAFTLAGHYKSNVDTMLLTSQDINLDFPVTPQKNAGAYRIYVGFQLTPDELALNRRRGPR